MYLRIKIIEIAFGNFWDIRKIPKEFFSMFAVFKFSITKEDVRKIERKIIRTMYSLNKWGSNHMLIKNLESGFPKHAMKKVKAVIIKLIKEELLLVKPTLHGKAVSLNIKNKDKIEETKDRSAIF